MDAKRRLTSLIIFIIITVPHFVTSQITYTTVKPVRPKTPFSQDNFIVGFYPYISAKDEIYSYGEDDQLTMITKISSKFSNVLAPYLGVNDEFLGNSRMHVAPAVAKFNSNSAKKRLKVFMPFGLGISWNDTGRSFDIVHKIAQRSNKIHPGTVEYLILLKDVDDDDVGEVIKFVELVKNKLDDGGKSSSQFKLGALFPLLDCNSEPDGNLSSYLVRLLPYFELVIFHQWPVQNDFDRGVKKTVLNFTRRMQRCKVNVRKLGSKIEVGFHSQWSDTDFKGKRNFSGLVDFWIQMNDWGTMAQTKIFMEEAFDVPIRRGNENGLGWWRLDSPREEYWLAEDDVFVDKMELERRREKEERENRPGGFWASTLNMILVAATVILTVTCVAIFIMYQRVSRKIERQQSKLISKEERELFFNGDQTSATPPIGGAGSSSPEIIIKSIEVIAYNREYELDKKSFTIDESSVLGSGNFGVVFKGTVEMPTGKIKVALKTLRKPFSSNALKDLLSEVKTMSYLGRHEHVVSLVGAYTRQLKKGIVYVFTEMCGRGSLEKHLRGMVPRRQSDAPGFRDTYYAGNVEANVTSSAAVPDVAPSSLTNELCRWSYEIACGMEFLVSKNVVHADLATRNVLLTQNLSAKISDFGLSRRLYDYQSYVRTQQGPLPWRSMSPESLSRAVFNEKTDVWAYGTTLWEIYSLGDQPYPGLSWTIDFTFQLNNGLRPGKPQYDADNMYSTMLKCWNIDPAQRPSFQELREGFKFE